MRLLIFLIFPFVGWTQLDSSTVELDIDLGPKYQQKVYSTEEKNALKEYSSQSFAEPVSLNRDIRGALNSNDYVAYHILSVNTDLILKHKIKKVLFHSGRFGKNLIASISFSIEGKESSRFIKYKYEPYTGDFSEFCLYKENAVVYMPSTTKLYFKVGTSDKGLANQFIFDDNPLAPIFITYEMYS